MRMLFLLSLIALFSSGCVMTDPQMQNEAQMRTNSAIQRLATRVERLEQRNEAIETRSESTSEELRQLRAMLEKLEQAFVFGALAVEPERANSVLGALLDQDLDRYGALLLRNEHPGRMD